MFRKLTILAVAALLLTSCAAKPESTGAGADTPVSISLEAVHELNSGTEGIATPVRVRFYELKNTASFERADYFALADGAPAVLGADLIEQDEVWVRPDEHLRIQRTLNSATRHLGVMVGYRDIDQAQWRAVVAIAPQHSQEIVITLNTRAVSGYSAPLPAR
jgi:type VI secretion system protein VasD